jgi:hypothetical protein
MKMMRTQAGMRDQFGEGRRILRPFDVAARRGDEPRLPLGAWRQGLSAPLSVNDQVPVNGIG